MTACDLLAPSAVARRPFLSSWSRRTTHHPRRATHKPTKSPQPVSPRSSCHQPDSRRVAPVKASAEGTQPATRDLEVRLQPRERRLPNHGDSEITG